MVVKAESISEVPVQFLECRAWRDHLFIKRDDRVTTHRRRVIEVARWRQCDRCGYETVTLYAVENGVWTWLKSGPPVYPDNYLVTGGADRDELRNAYVKSLQGGDVVQMKRRPRRSA